MTDKTIKIFNCENTNSNCNIYKTCNNGNSKCTKYNYNCLNNQYEGEISESINLKNVNQNMFINMYNRGRFGNYIYGAIFTIMALIQLEIFSGKKINDMEKLLKNDRSNSKLYSIYNCMLHNNKQSHITDKYYFLKNGVNAFKYFNCNHFNFEVDVDTNKIYTSKLICNNNVDILLKYQNDFNINYQKITSAEYIYIIDNVMYICINLYGLINIEERDIFLSTTSNIETIRLQANFNDIINKLKKIFSSQCTIKINKTNLDSNSISTKITFIQSQIEYILKQCFIGSSDYKFIAYLDDRILDDKIKTLEESYYIIPESHQLYNLYLNIDNNYRRTIKNILFDDVNNNVQNIYNLYASKNKNTNLVIAHFRGGDFEKYENDAFKVLTPQYYIDAINKIITQFNKQEIKVLCSYHPSDVIFQGYVNILKYKFNNYIKIITENDFISEFENSNDIFMNETYHVLFMSLFPNMILSNSTYSHVSADMNINIDKFIIGNNKLCYGIQNIESDIQCGMNGIYDWDDMYLIFYRIYKSKDLENNNQKIYFGTNINNSINKFNINDFIDKSNIDKNDLFEFSTHVIDMKKNFISLLINNTNIIITCGQEDIFADMPSNIQQKSISAQPQKPRMPFNFGSKKMEKLIGYKLYYEIKSNLIGGNIQNKILKYKNKILQINNILLNEKNKNY